MAALDSGYAEAISFSRDYISTPDLAQRLATYTLSLYDALPI